MARVGVALALLALSGGNVLAEQRVAGESEFAALLAGCWYKDSGPGELICFDGGEISEYTSGPCGECGIRDVGSYDLLEQRLELRGMVGDGPITRFGALSCDAVLIPNESLRMVNCTAVGTSSSGFDLPLYQRLLAPEQRIVTAGADAARSELLGCWTMLHEDPRITEHDQICFAADGTVETMRTLTDEGLGSSGSYEFDGERVQVQDAYAFPDGWLFRSEAATCSVRIDGDYLVLEDCSGANSEPFSMTFVRSTS